MHNNISVFTPTYNRGYCLEKLYRSLIAQTKKSFTWIVVDDGSSDNTQTLIEKWIDEKKVCIKYFRQENKGKMAAHNKGVELCDTDFFICVDSDDHLVDDAIQTICNETKEIVNEKEISGIILRKALFEKGERLHTNLKFKKNYFKTKLFDLYEKHGYIGDTALVYKTSILKKYPFPLFPNEKFISEAYIYNKIDDEYQMLFVNKEIVVCEYLEDGYSKNINKVIKENPNGYILYFNDVSKRMKSLRKKLGYTKLVVLCLIFAKKSPFSILYIPKYPILALMSLPYVVYIYIRLKLSNWTYKFY